MNSIRQINWVEMVVPNTEETSTFYSKVFGYTCESEDEGDGHTSYHVKDGNNNVLGICAEAVFPDWVKGWVPYIDVEDYDYSISQIISSGGEVHKEMVFNHKFKGQRHCLAIDPSGAPVMICESQLNETDQNG